jgi:hypothetical protein
MCCLLPGFAAEKLPVKIAGDLVVDKFTDDEVAQCLADELIRQSN